MNETMRRDVVIDPTGTKYNLLQTEVEKMGWNSVLSDGKQQFCCCEMEAVYLQSPHKLLAYTCIRRF